MARTLTLPPFPLPSLRHVRQHHESKESAPHSHSQKQLESQKLLATGSVKPAVAAVETVTRTHDEFCDATPIVTGKAAPPFTPALPPQLFTQLKGAPPTFPRTRGMPLASYAKWAFAGLRPGLSVRVVRAEVIASVPSVTEYIVHVEDLHTKVFWTAKKRFHEVYLLRKKVLYAVYTDVDGEGVERPTHVTHI